MNENIRRLANRVAEESKLYCVNPINTDSEQFEFFADVLTEYVIKECVEQCYKNIAAAVGSHASAHNSAVEKCVKLIKEHFGITK